MPAATKKIPLLWIVATAIVSIVITRGITLQSHSTNKETLLAFKRVDSSLMMANRMIENSNTIISMTMKEKMKRPESNAFAIIWSPKIDTAIDLTNKMIAKIEELKQQLKKEAGMHIEDGKEVFKEDNSTVVGRLMIKKEKAEELKNSLTAFAKDLIIIVPEPKRNHLPKLAVQNLLQRAQGQVNTNWAKAWFKNISTTAALTVLNKIENDVLHSGNIVADFLGSQFTSHAIMDELPEMLASQNSTYFLPGETLKIKAGIGSFITWVKPNVIIDGIKVDVSDYGYANYSKVVSEAEGIVPISISFTDPNSGLPVTKTTQVTYKVAPPK